MSKEREEKEAERGEGEAIPGRHIYSLIYEGTPVGSTKYIYALIHIELNVPTRQNF